MAGDWIKMRTALESDPAVLRMAELLSQDPLYIVGLLHRLWTWFDTNSADGRANIRINSVDGPILRVPGASAALLEVGWLRDCGTHILLPNWDRHNGKSAKRRCLDATRKSAKIPLSKRKKSGPEKRREESKESPVPLPLRGKGGGKLTRAERKAAERDDFAEAHNRQMWWAGLPIDVREAVSKENGWIGVDLFRPSSERLRELDAEAVASIAEKLSKCRRRA